MAGKIQERPYLHVKIQICKILKEDGRMNNFLQSVKAVIVVFSLFVLMVLCTKIQYIQVDYRLPPEQVGLKDKKVLLSFQDNRNPKDIIGAGAKSDYKNFSNNFSYSLARGTEKGFKIGVFDLPDLFMETFTSRLENLGLIVLKEKGGEDAEVVIVLNEFLLNRVKLTVGETFTDMVNRLDVERLFQQGGF
jgi:hypothetical protein